MTHISSIGAGIYSDLSFSVDESAAKATAIATPTFSNLALLFSSLQTVGSTTETAGCYKRIENIREFPAMGTPPNIVNVPTYGYKTSKQVQGQADAPSFEVVLNFIPDQWINTANYLGWYILQARQMFFRFTLLNSVPSAYGSNAFSTANSQYFWLGKMEALQINPQLTDANQATLTISIQSDFYGAFTGT